MDIGLPNFLHEKAVVLAAENGKHVICEKPLGRNIGEARTMLDAVRRAVVIHSYAENHMFIPHITKAKEMIDEGVIGNVFWVRSREAHFGPHSAWFWDPSLAGGGVLMDMGCHSASTALHLIGKRQEKYLLGVLLRFMQVRRRITVSPSSDMKETSLASWKIVGLPTVV